MKTLQSEGHFRGQPIAWELVQATNSDSVGVRITYLCTLRFDEATREWVKMDLPFPTVEGTLWIVKRDGTANERAALDLARVLKWSGDLEDITDLHKWSPPECDLTVQADEYNGKTNYRVQWIKEPGSIGEGKAIAKRLKSALGDTFKRIIAGKKIGAEAAADTPASDSPF